MKIRRTLNVLAAAALVPGVVALTAGPAQAGRVTYQYNFQEKGENEEFTGEGLCDLRDATIKLTNVNEAMHASANQPNLTEDEIEAALDGPPTSHLVISKFTYTETGSFEITEADGKVYAGHFTFWIGFSDNRTTDVFTVTFNVNGTSADGDRISGHFVGHATTLDDAKPPVVSFDKGEVKGCP